MRTNVRSTSLLAHDDLLSSGTLGNQCSKIYLHIVENGGCWSLQELSRATGISINAVSGRVNSMKPHLLVEFPKRKCGITGKTITPVGLPCPVQRKLFPEAA